MTSSSIVWTEEEAQYLRALLSWRPSKAGSERHPSPMRKAPVGEFRFLIMGTERCGKTSLLTRFAEGTPVGEEQGEPNPEYERGCRRTVQIEDQAYVVDALELRPDHLANEAYLRQAVGITEAAVLVYDVTSRPSFDRMAAVAEIIRDAVAAREYGLFLVGNKADDHRGEEAEVQAEVEAEAGAAVGVARQVSWAEGHRLAASFRIRCTFVETSARTGHNVDRIFPQLGKDVLKLRWLMQQRREQAEKKRAAAAAAAAGNDPDADDDDLPVKRRPRWRGWTRPWFQRRLEERKASMA